MDNLLFSMCLECNDRLVLSRLNTQNRSTIIVNVFLVFCTPVLYKDHTQVAFHQQLCPKCHACKPGNQRHMLVESWISSNHMCRLKLHRKRNIWESLQSSCPQKQMLKGPRFKYVLLLLGKDHNGRMMVQPLSPEMTICKSTWRGSWESSQSLIAELSVFWITLIFSPLRKAINCCWLQLWVEEGTVFLTWGMSACWTYLSLMHRNQNPIHLLCWEQPSTCSQSVKQSLSTTLPCTVLRTCR